MYWPMAPHAGSLCRVRLMVKLFSGSSGWRFMAAGWWAIGHGLLLSVGTKVPCSESMDRLEQFVFVAARILIAQNDEYYIKQVLKLLVGVSLCLVYITADGPDSGADIAEGDKDAGEEE